jgi:hypothetical protein
VATTIRFLAGLVLAFAGTSAFAQNVSALLDATRALEGQLEIEAAKSARAAQAFGATLSAADRRELQSACTTLVNAPTDAAAAKRLELMMSRYKDNNAEAIVRFCLEPSIARLRTELQTSRQTLERLGASGRGTEGNAELQSTLEKQQQLEQMISNIMKADHDPGI